jgi:pimeloyl-ACP methyl ester carboxylesterase
MSNFVESFIYHPPNRDGYSSCLLNRNNCQYIELYTDDEILVPMLEVINPEAKKYLIFSHGNASDIISLKKRMIEISKYCGVNVIVYDYVGFSFSNQYKPSERRCYKSLEAVMKYMIDVKKVSTENIYLMGQSLGTGIVVDYAAKHHWTNPIILLSPYKSIIKVVSNNYFLTSCDKFKSLNKMPYLKCPVQIFHGINDALIDISHAKALYEALPNKSLEPIWMPGIGHNDILESIEFDDIVKVLNYQL